MTDHDLRAASFFDRFAPTFDTLYDGKRSAFMRRVDQRFRRDMFIRYMWTFEQLGDLSGKTVLDIGCGSGPYLVEALKRGACHVTGVDPAPGMLALARERLAESGFEAQATLIEGFFPGVELKPHDCGIVMGVFDYLSGPQGFLEALRPLVTTSAVISFPSRHWFRTPARRFRYWLRRCPLSFFDDERIGHLTRNAGFDQIEVSKIPGAGMDYFVCLKTQSPESLSSP